MLSVEVLPSVNAALNALSAALLVRGWRLARAGRVREHRACMLSALAASTLFLVLYLVHHAVVGVVYFKGTGWARTFYLTVLATHTPLAAVVPFAALRMAYLGWKGRVGPHRRLGRWLVPAWLYVSVTGLVIFVMLYKMRWKTA
ncbi:MAG: DUF420 domain-containing protein [Elusimicrobia bacterium]|nr:DUF420 domain-containing protein [Elusimicrobiota bacterium]